MKIIKLFVIHMLLLSSFQTLAFSVTAKEDNSSTSKDNFSTPEGMAKVIHLQSDKNANLLEFAIVHDDALDSEKFILAGDGGNLIPYTLTLKATALVQDKPYRVKVRATLTTETIFGKSTETADKIISVTVEGLRITTADFSIPENHSDAIMLTTNQDFNENADVIFSIPSGADIDKFGLDGKDNNVLHFDSTDFEARENNIYSVEVTARRDDTGETTTKTITVTVTDLDDEAPTNIRIEGARVVDGQVALANNEGDDFVIGTLSATDPDTDTTTNALTFTIDNSPDFEIVNGNELKTKRSITAIGDIDFTVTVRNHVNQSTDKTFTIKVVDEKKI
ncbi:hypothetical protein BSPLISOX_2239, partial [uncultured Gammaproteobacteria bacterium]